MRQGRSIFISGGGPSGLAAALLFHQLGWEEIVLAERRASPQDFEKNKAFNYQVNQLSQALLRRLGINDRLETFGVANQAFTATTVKADGTANTQQLGIIDPNRPINYWTTRRNLLTMLFEAVEERNDGRIKVLYSHAVRGVERPDNDGKCSVLVEGPGGEQRSFTPDLLLACDGLSSVIRRSAQADRDVPDGYFDMIVHPSPSAQLKYKVLNLPPVFTACGGDVPVDNHKLAYVFLSRHKDPRRACSLFAFPVANPEHPRSVNMIREQDHVLWTIEDAEELLVFLEDAFPQLAIRDLVPREEAEDYVRLEAGQFPEPQHARNIHARLGDTELLLVGDSAHAFPPDLGMGVNSALNDLEVLAQHLESGDALPTALERYAKAQQPEIEALVRLVQTVFPEQYATRKWALRRWMLGFAVRGALNKIMPGLFDKHAFILGQDATISFTELERRKLRTDRRVKNVGIALAAAVAAGLLALFV